MKLLEMMALAVKLKEQWIPDNQENFQKVLDELSVFKDFLSKPFDFTINDTDFSLKNNAFTIWVDDKRLGELKLDVREINGFAVNQLMRFFLLETLNAEGGYYRGYQLDMAFDLATLRKPISIEQLKSSIDDSDNGASIRTSINNCDEFNNFLINPKAYWTWFNEKFLKDQSGVQLSKKDKELIVLSIDNIMNVMPHDTGMETLS